MGRASTIIAPDDFEINQCICIHSAKEGSNASSNLGGVAIRLTGIQYPFLVGNIVANNIPQLLDIRSFNFMKLSDEFMEATMKSYGVAKPTATPEP